MMPKSFHPIFILLIIALLVLPTVSFIASPMDWVFAPNHTRGLICPSLRYGCCPDLATWRHGSPCQFPQATVDPNECYKKREWACCQVKDDEFTCTTGFQRGKGGSYGWRSGTSEDYLGLGKGELTVEEKEALKKRI